MAFDSLQSLVEFLNETHQLARISESVSPHLEITEVTDRVVKKQGPALLFEHPTGYNYPVLTNVYGTLDRIKAIFDVGSMNDLGSRFEEFLNLEPPKGFIDKLKLLPKLKDLAGVFPRRVKDAPCQEVVQTKSLDVRDLPVLTSWPGDGGPFITLPVVITRNPRTGRRNVGMYRIQIYDSETCGMHWHIHKGGAEHFRLTQEPMQVAVALGPDPITTYTAIAPLPADMDELMLCRIPAQETCGSHQVRHMRSGSPRGVPVCPGGVCGSRRDASGRTFRRSYRILFAGRPVPDFSSNRYNPTQGPHISSDDSGKAPDGGRVLR